MTQLTNEEYIRDQPRCPFCLTPGNVDYDEVEMSFDTATQEASCLECGSEWFDVYRLQGYDPVNITPEAAKIRQKREESDGAALP